MNMIKKKIQEWKQKKLGSKISDIVFIVLIISIIIPSTRIEVVGFIHRIKALVIQPSEKSESKRLQLKDSDYNWEMVSLEEGKTNLNNYKGKVIFLNLWATWCPPCVGEMPEIQKMYNKFRDNEDIVFILLSNEEPEIINTFLKNKAYDLPAFIPLSRSPQILESRSIPTSYLISKSGEIVVRERGAVHWSGQKMERIINDLLKE